MAPKIPEQQYRINTQFNEDMAKMKTQLLFVGQALGTVVELLDGMVERLKERGLLEEGEGFVRDYRRSIDGIRKRGLRMVPPEDPNARVLQVKCPQCQAVIKVKPGQRVERCDWCGYVFGDDG